MNFFKRIKCDHEWITNGWSTIKCTKCGKVNDNEKDVNAYWKTFWEKRIIPGHPELSREAINAALIRHTGGDHSLERYAE